MVPISKNGRDDPQSTKSWRSANALIASNRAEREIGAVGHYQPRRAVDPGANNFITDQSIADLDLAGRRSDNAERLVLGDGSFADAGLCAGRTSHQRSNKPNCKQRESTYANSFHNRSIYPDIVPDRARKRGDGIITSGALQPHALVGTDSKCVQCDGHNNPLRPHSISPQCRLARESVPHCP